MRLPDQMRAVVLTGHGGLDKLSYREDWPRPEPGPGDVLVAVGACGLNNTDINTRTAWYAASVTEGITDAGAKGGFDAADDAQGSWSRVPLTFPRIQGADVAGRIAAVGAGVDPSRIGERVMIDPWIFEDAAPGAGGAGATAPKYFGSEVNGGYAEYTVAPARNVHSVRSDLTDAELATFPCAYTTAENLIARTQLTKGETIAIAGASGGVGSAAIQLSRIRGARVIAIASATKAEPLRALGAETVIDRAEPRLADAIRDAAGGPVDVAADVVGGALFGALIDALKPFGRYSSSGAIAGPMVDFDLRQLIYKDLQLTGATVVPPGTFARLIGYIDAGALKPLLAETFPLRALAQAQEAFLAKRHVGNIVVTTRD